MRSAATLVALTTVLVPITSAVRFNSSEGIIWAPGEECWLHCSFKQLEATTCSFNATASEAQTCACNAGDFVQNIDACIQADCPDQYDILKPELDNTCSAPTSMDSTSPDQTGLPFTIGDFCGIYCGFQASEESEKIDNCPIISHTGNDCRCASPTYMKVGEQCAREHCGSDADRVISVIQDSCSANSTNLPNADSANAGSPSGTVAPSRTITQAVQSSTSGGTPVNQPSDVGLHAAVISVGAVVVALAAFVGLV